MQIAACLFDCGAKFVELRHLLVVRVLRSVYSLTFGEVLRRSYAIFPAYFAVFHYLGKNASISSPVAIRVFFVSACQIFYVFLNFRFYFVFYKVFCPD